MQTVQYAYQGRVSEKNVCANNSRCHRIRRTNLNDILENGTCCSTCVTGPIDARSRASANPIRLTWIGAAHYVRKPVQGSH